MLNRIKPFVAYLVTLAFLAIVVCPANIWAQRSNRQTRREDPRGLNRYVLTGERAPLSIFSIPAYDPRDPDFFDGFGRMTAADLGLEGAKFDNEFGREARRGILDGKAVIRFPNGFQWTEAYLEGCLKSGKNYYNRIKLVTKPTITPPAIVKELCVNIPLALEDVPSDWTKTKRSDGKTECHYPKPEPLPAPDPIDNTCVPGAVTVLYQHHEERKGFIPADIIRQKEPDAAKATKVLSLIGGGNTLVTSMVVMSDGCNFGISTHSVKQKGMGWMKWLIPAAAVGGFLLGYYLRPGCKTCGTKVTPPKKTTPTNGSRVPIRIRRY